MIEPKLSDEAKVFVVHSLAAFESPASVAASVKKDFAVDITRQAIEAYDPTKYAGRNLGEPWKTIFEESRKAFVGEKVEVGIAHRAIRLHRYEKLYLEAERRGATKLAAELLVLAAKESGDAFTNKRQLEATGKDGAPLLSGIEVVFVPSAGRSEPGSAGDDPG